MARSQQELIDEGTAYYTAKGWAACVPGADPETAFCNTLTLAPSVCLKRDGMLLLLYVSNTISDTNHRLYKQVLFDVHLAHEHCHTVVTVERVSADNERRLAGIGMGVLKLRDAAQDPILLKAPKLTVFRGPGSFDRVPAGLRANVTELLRRIEEEDTAMAVMDLVQVIEQELDRLVPAQAGRPLGNKIAACRRNGVLYPLVLDAATRINASRIVRAHPRTHAERRRDIVQVCQTVVDDALAILFALPP